jgi:hypothetical protein
MPGMYEDAQPMKIADLGDTIYIAESEKTPLGRLLKRGSQPNQMLCEWPVQEYPRRKFTGTVDGYDISSFSHTTRDKMEAYGMWLMTEGWMVSKLANMTNAAGVGRKEKAKQAKDDALLLAFMHERQMLSDVDTRAEVRPSVSYRSRGVYSWLSPDAQDQKPVPAAYRPASACVHTGALSTLTASAMETMLESAATAKREAVDLTGYVGIKLKAQMSSWAQHVTDVGSHTVVQSFNMNAAEKKLIQVVDFFEFDAGTVRTIPSWYNLCTESTGEDSAYTPRSGAFLDMSMWEMRFFQTPAAYMEPPKSGGPRGYHDLVFILVCKNPLGQVMVKTNT